MEFKTLEELVEKGKQIDKKIVMAVPAAEGEYVIETAVAAKQEGLADSILIGNRAKLENIMPIVAFSRASVTKTRLTSLAIASLVAAAEDWK